jgi:hypothetical protein
MANPFHEYRSGAPANDIDLVFAFGNVAIPETKSLTQYPVPLASAAGWEAMKNASRAKDNSLQYLRLRCENAQSQANQVREISTGAENS